MNHLCCFLTAFTFTIQFLVAQAPDTLWTRVYGGSLVDEAFSIQQTSDNGFIVAGSTNSFGGSRDGWLIKTNENGDTLWTKILGGEGEDRCHSVQQTSDGGYIIVGYTKSYGAGIHDVWLTKTNASGDTVWTKTYGGPDTDIGYSVQQTSDGGFIITGWTASYGAGNADAWLIKTDAVGDTLWTKTFGGSNEDIGNAVRETTTGGYVITGNTESYGAGFSDAWILRTDASGDTLWTRTVGGAIDSEVGQDIQETSDGGFIMTGWTGSYGAGMNDCWLVKLSVSGDTVWTRTYGGSASEGGYAVQQTQDDGFIIAGDTQSFGAANNVYLVKTTASGDTVWTKIVGGSYDDWGKSIDQTSDGGYIVAGGTQSFGAGSSDLYLVRLAPVDTSGLVAYYPFNGNANDESGYGNDGDTTGHAPTLTEDRFGNSNSAFSFDGVDDYIELVDGMVHNLPSVSYFGWVKLSSVIGGSSVLSASRYASPSHCQNVLHFTADTTFLSELWCSSGDTYISYNLPASIIDTWVFIGSTYDGSTFASYINGVKVDSVVFAGGSTFNEGGVTIGKRVGGDYQVHGIIDDIRIYNRALSISEIDSLYHDGGWDTGYDLVAYYPFNGNANDESGYGNDGDTTGHAPALTEDRFGNPNCAYSFDGVDDYIAVPNNAIFDFSSDQTLSAWIRHAEPMASEYMTFSKQLANNSSAGWFLSVNGSHHLNLQIYPSLHHVIGTGIVTPDEWVHIVLQYDSSVEEMRFYINKQLDMVESFPVADLPASSPIDFWIGAMQQSNGLPFRPFKGEIDDIRIYSGVLDSQAIDSLYHESGWGSLVAYYPFNGNADDASGNGNDGDTTGHAPALTEDRFGNPNSAYSFNGVDDHIWLGDNPAFKLEQFTISGWFNNQSSQAAARMYRWRLRGQTVWIRDDTLEAYANDVANTVRVTAPHQTSIDRWHAFGFTYDGDSLRLYLDGEEVAVTYFPGPVVYGSGGAAIGRDGDFSADYYTGHLDDIRIYNRALSISEIDSLYHDGGWDTGGDLVAYYPFNGNANDESGYGNDGDTTGHAPALTEDRFGNPNCAYSFDGVDDYITVPNNAIFDFNSDQTFSAWIRHSEPMASEYMTFSKQLANNSSAGWFLSVNGSHHLNLQIYPSLHHVIGTGIVTPDEWVHIVLQYDSSAEGMRFYINKQLDLVESFPVADLPTPSPIDFWIGAMQQSSGLPFRPFKGEIDDIRIYSRALSAEEIDSLYHEGGWTDVLANQYGPDIPSKFALHSNYPNPFNPRTVIRFDLPRPTGTVLIIYDILGREIIRLVDRGMDPGYHQVLWNGRDGSGRGVPSGIYIARLVTPEYSKSIKMVFLK
ncbi:MAG: T9SS type A sorting domain-containing protein [Fidelibacterota bacterium]|nr:MAG: T9SS type A sorting domain-containing protein [Candidatus Neomarinimicrobiota bacterium]